MRMFPHVPVLFGNLNMMGIHYLDHNGSMSRFLMVKEENIINGRKRVRRWIKDTRIGEVILQMSHFSEMSHFSNIFHGEKGKLMNLLIIAPNKFNTFPFFTSIDSI